MMETLLETIRSAEEAIERARMAAEATRRVIAAAQLVRDRSFALRAEAAQLVRSRYRSRYNRPG